MFLHVFVDYFDRAGFVAGREKNSKGTDAEDKTKTKTEDARTAGINDSAYIIAYERGVENTRGADALIVDEWVQRIGVARQAQLSRKCAESGDGAAFG